MAALEAMLAIFGSVWLLATAQRRLESIVLAFAAVRACTRQRRVEARHCEHSPVAGARVWLRGTLCRSSGAWPVPGAESAETTLRSRVSSS